MGVELVTRASSRGTTQGNNSKKEGHHDYSQGAPLTASRVSPGRSAPNKAQAMA